MLSLNNCEIHLQTKKDITVDLSEQVKQKSKRLLNIGLEIKKGTYYLITVFFLLILQQT